ncbi:MAG: cold-shock protein [Pseudorhizobium sp.]
MSQPVYSVGNTVVLKSGTFRKADNERTCCIALVLPESQGITQYRVRFGNEGFERRITEAEIDRPASPEQEGLGRPASPSATSSWVNPNAVRIKK